MKKKKTKMFENEVLVAKFISSNREMEVELYWDDIKNVGKLNTEFRMSIIMDSVINYSNPLKPKKKNKKYVSRINCKAVFEMKDDGLYYNGKPLETETIEINMRIIKPEDIN